MLLLLVSPLLSATVAPAPPKPNFVIIFADDLGYGDVGPFGSKLNRTPHLDRMAQEGMKLTSFYAAPVCTPSRAQILSGCYAKRVSLPNVIFPASPIGLNTNELTLPRLLKQQGYATMAIGKWHLGDQPDFLPTRQGFDHYLGLPYSNDMGPAEEKAAVKALERELSKTPAKFGRPGDLGITRGPKPPLPLIRDEAVAETLSPAQQDSLTGRYVEEAVKFVREHQAQPFFLYLAHAAVHVPLHPGPDFRGKSKNGLYGDWVEEVDWSVGRVLAALRELKLDRRTLVIFTSDNGPWLTMGTNGGVAGPLRGGKGSTWEGGMREPTIAWWPGRIAAGSSSDAVMANFDLLPTFVKLAGGTVPAQPKIDGVDIWPVLSGQARGQMREALYYFKANQLEAVRSGPWKLTLPGQGGGLSGKSGGSESPVTRLYNLDEDIGETKDVAARHPEVVQRLEKLVESMDADLGRNKLGPGVRAPGRVAQPVPLVLHGTSFVMEEAPGAAPVAKSLEALKVGEVLERAQAPQVAKRPLTITAEVHSGSADGVILAHGGNTTGYALYLREGQLFFTVRENQQRFTIRAPGKCANQFNFEARLTKGGEMLLAVDGRTVAQGKAAGLLPVQPQEHFCLGLDDEQPVGDYPAESRFQGQITRLNISTDKP